MKETQRDSAQGVETAAADAVGDYLSTLLTDAPETPIDEVSPPPTVVDAHHGGAGDKVRDKAQDEVHDEVQDPRLLASLIAHRTAALDDAPEPPPRRRWVVFTLGDERFGVEVLCIREVVRLPRILPVPGAPRAIRGVMNLRGNVIPVVDARHQFGLPTVDPDGQARVMVLEHAGRLTGLLVGAVPGVLDVPETEVENAPQVGAGGDAGYIEGVVSRDGQLTLLIDAPVLLASVHGDVADAGQREQSDGESGPNTADSSGATAGAAG